jgi:D-ribulokinase
MAVSDEPRFIDGVWGPYFSALTPRQWLPEGRQSAFGAAIDHIMRLHPAFASFTERTGEKAFEMEHDIMRAPGRSRAPLGSPASSMCCRIFSAIARRLPIRTPAAP